MRGLDEVFIFECWNTRLTALLIHCLQLGNSVLLNLGLNNLNDLFIIRQVGTVALETNHVQCGGSLKRAMDMVEFPWVLGFVQIGRHATVSVRLRSQQIRV